MRVRVNFTIEVDPEEYREAMGEDLDKEQVRNDIQERAITDCVIGLSDQGVHARLLGRNNVYDAKSRTTRSEQLTGNL